MSSDMVRRYEAREDSCTCERPRRACDASGWSCFCVAVEQAHGTRTSVDAAGGRRPADTAETTEAEQPHEHEHERKLNKILIASF